MYFLLKYWSELLNLLKMFLRNKFFFFLGKSVNLFEVEKVDVFLKILRIFLFDFRRIRIL